MKARLVCQKRHICDRVQKKDGEDVLYTHGIFK